MTSDAHTGIGEGGFDDKAGAATDQHITGHDEDGSFITDEAPTDKTPSHGSSNLGINKRRANREITEEQQ
jgi:hypothetical protein